MITSFNKLHKNRINKKKLPVVRSVLKSKDGVSKNYIINYPADVYNSIIEARYVRRHPSYISSYISSMNGCRLGCSFCHLTATNQTNFNHVDIETFGFQLNTIL